MSLQYPTANDLELWFDIIQRNQEFGPYLPAIDDGWIDSIQSDGQRLSSASARLFYRIIKNHHFVDGNKRSAVLMLFMLLDFNEMEIEMNWIEMYDLAKEVASSFQDSESVIADLSERFERLLTPLP